MARKGKAVVWKILKYSPCISVMLATSRRPTYTQCLLNFCSIIQIIEVLFCGGVSKYIDHLTNGSLWQCFVTVTDLFVSLGTISGNNNKPPPQDCQRRRHTSSQKMGSTR